MNYPDTGPTKKELQGVKDVIGSFLIALKNFSLYPEKHLICQKSIAKVRTLLDDFLKDHDCLRLDVDKDRLLFGNEVVLQSQPGKENLPLLLFRDGILWLEFRKGITLIEIRGFLKILNKYKNPREEAEGDLVTALWEVDFPKLKYQAANVYLENEPLIDLSLLNAGGPQDRGPDREEGDQNISAENSSTDQPEEKPKVLANVPLHSTGDYLWELSPEESEELRQMVLELESGDSTQDILDVLLVVINDQREGKDLATVLGFLADDFKDTLAQGDFKFALRLLHSLHKIRQTYKTEKPWALPALNNFFAEMSTPRVLNLLSQVWPTLDSLEADRIKSLRQFLLLLPSEAILALGPMLPQIRSSNIQRQIMEVIGIMAKRNLRPLEQLINDSEEFVVQRLVNILGHIQGEKPTQILLKMIHHSSGRVRKEALKHLLGRDEEVLKELFGLIDDPDNALRRLMLDYLGSRRNKLGETLLLDYLGKGRFRPANRQHLLACYKALGRCASSGAILFLREKLLNKCWIPSSIRSLHRQGAVVALIAMETEDSKEILRKASRSLFPSVRLAYRKAVEAGQ